MVAQNLLCTKGQGKGTKYIISPAYGILSPINIEKYYEQEIDERDIKKEFNFELITNLLSTISLFNSNESIKLNALQQKYTQQKLDVENLVASLSQ